MFVKGFAKIKKNDLEKKRFRKNPQKNIHFAPTLI